MTGHRILVAPNDLRVSRWRRDSRVWQPSTCRPARRACSARLLVWRVLRRQCLYDGLRAPRRNAQKRARRSFGLPASLLPTLQCRDTHPDHEREFRLGLGKLQANRPDVVGPKLGHAAGLEAPLADRTRLLDAGHKPIEVILLHLNSSATRRRKMRSCAGVSSSCLLFRYIISM